MKADKKRSGEKKPKNDQSDDSKEWQIDPLKDYKKSEGKMNKESKKKQEGDEDSHGKMGFDEWSVSWP